jgi:hypothetical protein
VYTPTTARYAAAAILFEHGQQTFAAILEKLAQAAMPYTRNEMRSALINMKEAKLAGQQSADNRWYLTKVGRSHWTSQHASTAATESTAHQRRPLDPQPLPIEHDRELLTRGIVRLNSPASRLPMVYRDGAMDFAACPRIDGPYRVWPDGRRERIDGGAA